VNDRDHEDLLAATARLRSALAGVYGKIRDADALVLAGFERPSFARRKLVAAVMRDLGWDRVRLRFDGVLSYAYARGSQLEREATLYVEFESDEHPGVKRREP
jgi:hypothetical protein